MLRHSRVFLFFLIFSSALFGQDPELIKEGSWHRGPYLETVYTPQGFLIVASANGLEILQPQIDGPMERIGQISLGTDHPKTLVANENTAFVLTGEKILFIDLSSPLTPVLMTSMALQSQGAYLEGHNLFLFGERLIQLDISQPSEPVILFQDTPQVDLSMGYLRENHLITVNVLGEVIVRHQAEDGTWQPSGIDPNEGIGKPSDIVHQNDFLYLAQDNDLHAFQIQPDGAVIPLGQISINAPILDLALHENHLVLASLLETTSFIPLGPAEEPFGRTIQLPIPKLNAVTPANAELFFGISRERGLEQYRPNVSFRLTTTRPHPSPIVDVAFQDPFAFLATETSLEVLNFSTSSQPSVIATYAIAETPYQKLVYRDHELHLITHFAYQRYQVAEDGTLRLKSSQDTPLGNAPLLAMQALSDRILVATPSLFYVITSEGTEVFDISSSLNFFTPRRVRATIDAPYMLVRSDNIVNDLGPFRTDYQMEIFQLDGDGVPALLAKHMLKHSEFPLPNPIFQGHLIFSGQQIFDARRMNRLREYPRANMNLDSAFLDSGFLYGVGQEGLQIWDFERPEHPTKVWSMPDMDGDHLYFKNGQVLIFNEDPQSITYFSSSHLDEGHFFPYIQNDSTSDEQIVFHNSSDREEPITLKAFDASNQSREQRLTIPPRSTEQHAVRTLFPHFPNLSLRIRGSRLVTASYSLQNNAPVSGMTSPAITTPAEMASLDRHLTLQLPKTPGTHKVVIASPDEATPLTLKLQFLSGKSLVDEKSITLTQANTFQFSPHIFFDGVESGMSGTINVACEEKRIDGVVATDINARIQTLAKANDADTMPMNPLRLDLRAQRGFSPVLHSIRTFGDTMLIMGRGGLAIKEANKPLRSIFSETRVHDAHLDEQYLWVLLEHTLEVRDRHTNQLIHQIPNRFDASRFRKQGDLLFIWHPFKPGFQIWRCLSSQSIVLQESLGTFGDATKDILLHRDLLYVATESELHTYPFHTEKPGALLSRQRLGNQVRQLTVFEDFLFVGTRESVIRLQLQENTPPSILAESQIEGFFIDQFQDTAIFYDLETFSYSIIDLMDFSIRSTGSFPDIQYFSAFDFQEKTLWLYGDDDTISRFELRNHGQFELIESVEEFTSFRHILQTQGRTFALTTESGSLTLYEVQLNNHEVALMSSLDLGDGGATGMVTAGDYLYISSREQGLITVYVGQGHQPRRTFTNPGNSYKMVGNERFVCTLEGIKNIRIFDLQNPAEPQMIKEFPATEYRTYNIALDGHLLLIADCHFGLDIWDLSDPSNPRKASEIDTSRHVTNAWTLDVTFHQNHAYLADHSFLTIVDYADPNHPVLVKRIPTSSQRVQVVNGYLFDLKFASTSIYDLSNPKAPFIAQSLDELRYTDSSFDGDSWWVATGSSIQVWDYQPLRSIIPWVATNSAFQTQVQLTNLGETHQTVRLRAMTPNGTMQTTTLDLAPFSETTWLTGDLFPELTGYALSIETPSTTIEASYAIAAVNSDGGTLSQAQSPSTPTHQLQDGLVLNFPADSHTRAFAMVAPLNHTLQPVTLQLFDTHGLIAETEILLQKAQPTVQLLSSLFPQINANQALTLTASSTRGALLTGTTFLFNEERSPATTEAQPQSALYLTLPGAID